jgi:hypothetical protein
MKLLFVTAYKHLGREAWYSARSFDLYLEYFKRIVHLDPVCFCDEPYATRIKELGITRVLPYDESDTFFPKYLNRQHEILYSEEFTKKLPYERQRNPGYEHAEYGLVCFSKTSFVRRASDLFPNYTHYAWIDFGYSKGTDDVPSSWSCSKLLHDDKILIGSCRDLFFNKEGEPMYGAFNSQDRSQALQYNWNNPWRVHHDHHYLLHGNFWIAPKHLTHWFEKEMDRSIQRHHEIEIANHDEPYMVQIIHDFPSRFHIHVKEKWTGDFEWFKAPSKVNVLWVTAFKDIGRSNWSLSQRSFAEYKEAFNRIKHLQPVCFIDEPWASELSYDRIFPLNDNDTFIAKHIERQKEILKDSQFRKLIPEKFQYNPEFHYPEYGLVNCAKTCFIRRASEMFPEYTHYSWIDFGFAKTPEEAPPYFTCDGLVDDEKILISSFRNIGFDQDGEAAMGPYGIPSNQMVERYNWNNPKQYLVHPPHIIQGNHWVVPKNLTHWLEQEMDRSIQRNHELGIVRADESFFLPIIHDFRNRFYIHVKPYSDVTWITNWFWKQIQPHFEQIKAIIEPTFDQWRGAGSYLMNGQTLNYDHTMLEKQLALFKAARNSKHAIEIGVHAGHSLLIMLLSNPTIHIECIDICIWSHTEKCVEYLNRVFNNRVTLRKGDSRVVLPTMTGQFDLIHVDGSHDISVIREEMNYMSRLETNNSVYVFDDYDTPGLSEYIHTTFKNVHVAQCPWRNCIASIFPQ